MDFPINAWVYVNLPNQPPILAFTFLDHDTNLSARGREVNDQPTPDFVRRVVEQPDITIRLWPACPVTPLTAGEVARLELPTPPPWVKASGAVPRTPPWRLDTELQGKFHAKFPDDVAALFYFPDTEGCEKMWVRITATDDSVGGYAGELLNSPRSALPLRAGDPVSIRVTPGLEDPLYIDPVVRANLTGWTCRCAKCGFDLVLIPVRELQRRQYPDLPPEAERLAFATRCAACGEGMLVRPRGG
jgi:hypothetical protein